uniref:Uncharacterized protein LOC111123766 isoform X2 n=1 Tax=Crassostrea virginica TaxID=6565 RepID=A0A8B8D6L6_CRAVI|nr:uncharacterized protein LOC111123766 isoform X2 [Crassostrea virginica]
MSLMHRSLRMLNQMNFAIFLGLLFVSLTYGYVIQYETDPVLINGSSTELEKMIVASIQAPQSNSRFLENLILTPIQLQSRNPTYQKRNIANLDFTVGSGHLHQRNYLMFQQMLKALNAGNSPSGR